MSIEFFAGDDKVLQFTVTQAGSTDPLDLTNAEIMFRMIKEGNVEINKSIGTGVTVVDAAAGRLDVTINSSDTVDIFNTVELEYELQLRQAGLYDTVKFDTLTIKRNIINGPN